jgi:serine/threonine protein kinase
MELGTPDKPKDVGALKEFMIPSGDKAEEARAEGRLGAEIKALGDLEHPAILKLLHANAAKRFIVTEYHPGGTLEKHLARYKGRVLAAMEALRPIVEAVVAIHNRNAIHRDIKPVNIFVAGDGHLVLGDLGIVIYRDDHRLTATKERVVSHFWMAPWAYKNEKLEIEEIRPTLDIYPLARVLWSMIAGRNGFSYWEYDRDENNLERLFPNDPMMPLVNCLFSKSIVREEVNCLRSAKELLLEIDKLIDTARLGAYRPEASGSWPCQICGRGRYSQKALMETGFGGALQYSNFAVYVCDKCGHAELFKLPRSS